MRHDLNIYVMAASQLVSLEDIHSGKITPQQVVKEATEVVQEIISDFAECIHFTLIPKEYAFLKMLSANYIKTASQDIKKYK